MQSGEARIAETSSIDAMRQRRWTSRRSVPNGVLRVLTLIFWTLWIYLILPLLSLMLWIAGVELFVQQIGDNGYRSLLRTLASYGSVLLILVGLLAVWIAWNVVRYGGSSNRRKAKRPEVTDLEVWQRFHVDESIGRLLRERRYSRLNLDEDGCPVLLPEPTLPAQRPATG
ncbi:MAG TPA: poly-beta-1,6-N-acetyl-D-glucosamine biosynthesis protein PgaD [Thermoanaerobaculia bacterium]|jgi:poly-beta-1,6-N-acetyl-D-glucosamine biosynthesis protein PgaD|nr:poly-beta-1,6-N-acetyl-D-glucosamine biosynthesis protein PgaD [Thermoanaerobaculia bacterium]